MMKKLKKLIGLDAESPSGKSASCSPFDRNCADIKQLVTEHATAAQTKARSVAKSLSAFNERTQP